MVEVAFRLTAVAGAEDHIAAALAENARASRAEPGAIRFDVLRSTADPAVFLVVEAYGSDEAFDAHRQTPHYATWKAASADRIAANERYEPLDTVGMGG